MDIEIFVHGVPNGHDTWGKTSVEKYFDSFYGPSCNDERRYHIQVVQSNGKFFCYYNYLVYNNVQDYNGRSGSFIGLTVRMDEYCKDFSIVYSVLDTIFNAYLNRNIIEQNTNRWRYLVASFKEKSDVLNSVYEATFQLLTQVLKKDNVCSLNDFVRNQTSKLLSYNLNEVSNQNVEQIIRQYGQIILSPFYPTNKEREIERRCNDRINDLTQQYNNRIETFKASKDQELQSYKTKIATIEQQFNKRIGDEVSKKDQEIRSLNDKLASVDKECNERVSYAIQKKTQEIKDLGTELEKKNKEVSNLKKTIQRLQASCEDPNRKTIVPKGQQPFQTGKGKNLKPSKVLIISIINTFLLLILLLFLVISLIQIKSLGSDLRQDIQEDIRHSIDSISGMEHIENSSADDNPQKESVVKRKENDTTKVSNDKGNQEDKTNSDKTQGNSAIGNNLPSQGSSSFNNDIIPKSPTATGSHGVK